ncbi:DNA-processing protein DprA [Chitinophaga barathri]|uniref:DNA-protecting protein DprA n=1 Tax=Chitinophaga barathri TaxID=1647451 RepID=A0A3N4MGX2_9BACT|nr:DNA-processing protein DprA [Chitinophaga barathri]RPD38889.1 DNA-protecting protein DprA [Chitinophaga barathri]
MREELHYRIALTFLPLVGDVAAKKLLEVFGSASAIFQARRRELESIPGIGEVKAAAIKNFRDFYRVEAEARFLQRHHIRPVFYTDDDYPKRLQHCYDSPVLLYYKGKGDLQPEKVLGIVGTRRPTVYGSGLCRDFVKALAPHGITIVSGMAYGIDITAHQAALEHGLPTIGVLAHGLNRLYPASHARIAGQMLETGGLLSDFSSGAELNRQNFPRRNRIVAGLCDAILVVESGSSGGSLITADIACGYNRDVLAIPGRIGDESSAGCLDLVKQNKAALVTSPEDVLRMLDWRPAAPTPRPAVQSSLFLSLKPKQQDILHILSGHSQVNIDELQYQSGIPRSSMTEELMQLEMLGLVRSMPGHTYQLIST